MGNLKYIKYIQIHLQSGSIFHCYVSVPECMNHWNPLSWTCWIWMCQCWCQLLSCDVMSLVISLMPTESEGYAILKTAPVKFMVVTALWPTKIDGHLMKHLRFIGSQYLHLPRSLLAAALPRETTGPHPCETYPFVSCQDTTSHHHLSHREWKSSWAFPGDHVSVWRNAESFKGIDHIKLENLQYTATKAAYR